MRSSIQTYILLLVFCVCFMTSAQNKHEREHRIRKIQFPEKALEYITKKLDDAKRTRFYREIDSSTISYKAKFKKDRLWYNIEFDKTGAIENVEIAVKPIDIPDEALAVMNSYLSNNFTKYKIRKIQQQYRVSEMNTVEETVKNAFQNLMLPTINYELIIKGKKDKRSEQHEALFDSEGNFKSIRRSLPPNYDHVLY